MKSLLFSRTAVLAIMLGTTALWTMRSAAAEDVADALDAGRSIYATDREAFVARNLTLTETEEAAFWPLYRQYRSAMEGLGDDLVKLMLEYSDVYPNVPEDRARELLRDYTKLEKNLASERAWYLKKFAQVLPPSKALRFAQLENRMDLALRMQLASRVPLVPVEGQLAATSMGYATVAEGVPGGMIVQTRELIATVTAVDKGNRKLTLLSPEGVKETVKVGPEVTNFPQIKVGDRLKITATEELVVRMAEPGEAASNEASAVVALAPKGAKPGGVMAETVQLTATVTAIDPQQRTATVRFENGSTRTLRVRDDIDLSKHKTGEKVVLSATEKVAISVGKP